jgi:drug/metabolite transporter (DMT)-like permease
VSGAAAEEAASHARGIAAMVLAIALFAAMDATIKHLRADLPAMEILFFRLLIGGLPVLWLIRREGGWASARTNRLLAHAGRTVLTLAALFCFFHAYRTLPLVDAYTVMYASPLLATALGVPVLGERVDARRWAAVLVGFAGVMVVLRPGGAVLGAGGLVALAGAFFLACNMTMLRLLSRTESNGAIVGWFTLFGTALSGLLAALDWHQPVGEQWLWLVAMGLFGGFGQIAITEAFRCAPVAVVTPFQYTSLIWGLLFGVVLFGDVPDAAMLVGAAIVVGAGVYVVQREARSKAPPAGRVGRY